MGMGRFAREWLTALLLIPGWMPAPASAEGLVLGVLMEIENPDPRTPGLEMHFRLAFRKVGDQWAPVCRSKGVEGDNPCNTHASPGEQHWTAYQASGAVGRVTTQGWVSPDWHFMNGLLRVVSTTVTHAGRRSRDFGGWSNLNILPPVVALSEPRPVLATSWKRVRIIEKDRREAFELMRVAVPAIPSCRYDDQGQKVGKATPLRARHVEVFTVMADRAGDRLVGARIRMTTADGCLNEGWFESDVWFRSSPGARPRTVVGLPHEGWSQRIHPLHVADFDGDGQEEALFWFSGYNEDGFLLAHDRFRKVARFTWGYH